MELLHPMIVHFPIALTITAGGFYLYHFRDGDEGILRFATWLHILGLLGMLLAILSGNLADGAILRTDAIDELTSTHELQAYLSLWVFAMMLVWFWLRSSSWQRGEKMAYVAVYLLLLIPIFLTARTGGKLVYEEGAGVAPVEASMPMDTVPGNQQTDF